MAKQKSFFLLALLLAALVLSGCAGEIITELYIEDIVEVMEGDGELLLTTGTIILESPDEEYQEMIEDLIVGSFRGAGNFRNKSEDFSEYILADIKIPVLDFDGDYNFWEMGDPIAVAVYADEDGSYGFGLYLNEYVFEDLFAAFNEESWQSISIKDFDFSVRLVNDRKGTALVLLDGVYVDRYPVAYYQYFELDRRESLEIVLSDVYRDSAYEDGVVFFGYLED